MAKFDVGITEVSAAGHQSMMTDFNRGQRTKYYDNTMWRIRCESPIGRLSDSSWFDLVDNQCQDTVLWKGEPTGLNIRPLSSYNQELKTDQVSQSTYKMKYGEWIYMQWKFDQKEAHEKCDFSMLKNDLKKKVNIQVSEFMTKQMMMRISCVDSCYNGACKVDKGSDDEPLLIDVSTSVELARQADSTSKNKCDPRGFVLIVPQCYSHIFTSNKEVKDLYQGCCSMDVPTIKNMPPQKIGNTTILFMEDKYFTKKSLGAGKFVYKIPHIPFGSFAYAMNLAATEEIASNSNVDFWGTVHRIIIRYGMGIPDPRDYTNYHVVFDDAELAIPKFAI